MPIYDYVCTACRHRFEVFHGLNEAGPHQCPVCGSPVSRVFAPPTIVFKGSGWAKLDRRYSGAPEKKASASGSGKGSDGGSGGTTSRGGGGGGGGGSDSPSSSSSSSSTSSGEGGGSGSAAKAATD